MTHTLSIIIAAALVNNVVLIQLFGVSSLFYASQRLTQAIEFALYNFLVLLFASMANLLIYRLVLLPLGIEFLRLIVFVMIAAAIGTTLLRLIAKHFPLSLRQQGLLIFLAGGNSAVLGSSLISSNSVLDLGEILAMSFGTALGFALVLVGFSALRIRLDSADIPQPFRGSAVLLISAGFVALSLLGFAGLS